MCLESLERMRVPMFSNLSYGETMEENEVLEIPFLLSRSHLKLLENLAESHHCTVAEVMRRLLVEIEIHS